MRTLRTLRIKATSPPKSKAESEKEEVNNANEMSFLKQYYLKT